MHLNRNPSKLQFLVKTGGINLYHRDDESPWAAVSALCVYLDVLGLCGCDQVGRFLSLCVRWLVTHQNREQDFF